MFLLQTKKLNQTLLGKKKKKKGRRNPGFCTTTGVLWFMP